MKFMISWQFHARKLQEGLAAFSQMTPEQDAADRGEGIASNRLGAGMIWVVAAAPSSAILTVRRPFLPGP